MGRLPDAISSEEKTDNFTKQKGLAEEEQARGQSGELGVFGWTAGSEQQNDDEEINDITVRQRKCLY